MQDAILRETIRGMQRHLESLRLDNIEEIEQGQQAYFQLLKALRGIPMPLELSVNEAAEEVVKQEEIIVPTGLNLEPGIEDPGPDTPEKAYRFERKLRGGYLPEINAFVPEYRVRDLGFEHGDMVYATPIPGTEDAPRYTYKLAESSGKPLKERIFFPYCIVEYDSFLNALVVSRTASGKNIRIDEVPQTLLLPENDVQELKVQAGDIVDVAYFKSNPNHKKIVWKYETFELEEELSKAGPVKAKLEKREKKEYEQNFKGKTVLMLGFEPGQSEFAKEIEQRGGSFLFLHGREPRETMAAVFSKADAAIFMLGHVSHNATIWASQFCKDSAIPFTGLHTFGRSSFIRTAQELLSEAAAVLPYTN